MSYSWCRQHAGKTYCSSNKPLPAGAEFCEQCRGYYK